MAGVIARVLVALAGAAMVAGFVAWPLVDDWRWIVVGVASAAGLGIVGAAFGSTPVPSLPSRERDVVPHPDPIIDGRREGPGSGVAP